MAGKENEKGEKQEKQRQQVKSGSSSCIGTRAKRARGRGQRDVGRDSNKRQENGSSLFLCVVPVSSLAGNMGTVPNVK